MSQAEQVKLLKSVEYSFGREWLNNAIPEHFHLIGGPHSTGCQWEIYLKAEGHPAATVWMGSVWYSSTYEFNDREKVLGFQPGMQFAYPKIEAFFEDIQSAYEEHIAKQEEQKILRQKQEAETKEEAANYYKKLLSR
jgi:hypothetical protein